MALEIERRFLVRGDQWRTRVRWSEQLAQGYLVSREDGLTLRVRLADGDRAWLTLKAAVPSGAVSSEAPLSEAVHVPADKAATVVPLIRQEFEYAIPRADGEALLAQAPNQVLKHRYGLDLPGGDWVLDVFEGANAPLVVAEVELPDAGTEVVVPPWCGPEITGRHDLSNAALARHPLNSWSTAELGALLGPLD